MMMKNSSSYILLFILFAFCMFFSSGALADPEQYIRTCPTMQDYINEGIGKKCFPCEIYEIVFRACSGVVKKSWNTFAKPLQAVVALGAAIYVAMYTLKNVFSFSRPDTMAYLSGKKGGIVLLLVKATVVILMLQHENFIYSYLLGPAVSAGLDIGGQLTGNGIGGNFGNASDVDNLFKLVIERVRIFNDSSYKIIAYGKILLCISTLPEKIYEWHFYILIFGVGLLGIGAFLLISLAFYLLDVLFRLAVGCIVLPFAIACGFSKFTSKYTQSTWALFVNVIFNFIMLGVLFNFTEKIIDEIISSSSSSLAQKIQSNTLFTKSSIEQIVKEIDIDFAYNFLRAGICGIIAFKLFADVNEITTKVSGANADVGKLTQEIASTGITSAKSTVLNVAHTPKFVKAATSEASISARRTGKNVWKKVKNWF